MIGSRHRLPATAHTAQPWRIHELAPEFALMDVWALPTPGGPEDFPRLVRWALTLDPTATRSTVVRALFGLRRLLGELFGWDEPAAEASGGSLRERMPADPGPAELEFSALPASVIYATDRELAAEIRNETVHGVLHLGWVDDGTGGYRGQLAVLVQPKGALGRVYLAAINPFRHLLVYPALLRAVGSYWERGRTEATR